MVETAIVLPLVTAMPYYQVGLMLPQLQRSLIEFCTNSMFGKEIQCVNEMALCFSLLLP